MDYFIMSQTERVFDILYQLSSEEGCVTLKEIAERYEISTRQAARDIEYVRTRIFPSSDDIVYDWKKRAYRLSEEADTLSYWKENMLISLSIYNNAASDRFLTTNSYLNLSNVRIGYSFPKKWTEKILLNNLNIWVSGDNLFCLSARKGYIPYASADGSSSASQYSPLSTVMCGIKLQF